MGEDQAKNEKENEKKIALNFLTELLAKIPPERRSNPEIGFGPKTLTIEQLVAEVEEGSDEGNLIIEAINEMITKYGLDEMLKREAKK